MSLQTRRERQHERQRTRILDAAVRVFAESGYDDATMSAIAAEAGCAAASLYTYFESKTAIFDALERDALTTMETTFETWTPEELTLRARLELLIRSQFRWAEGQRQVLSMLSRVRNPKAAALYRRCMTSYLSGGRQELGAYTPQCASLFLSGLLEALTDRAWVSGEPLDPDDVPEALNLFFFGILGHSEPAQVPT